MGTSGMLSSRLLGLAGAKSAVSRAGSEQRAIDANVSMITLIHSNCSTVNGALTPNSMGPRNATARALTLIVSWN